MKNNPKPIYDVDGRGNVLKNGKIVNFDEKLLKSVDFYGVNVFTERFIEKFKDILDWDTLLLNQEISEELIIENKHRFNWDVIAALKKLPLEFIFKNHELFNIKYLMLNFKYSEEEMKKIKMFF